MVRSVRLRCELESESLPVVLVESVWAAIESSRCSSPRKPELNSEFRIQSRPERPKNRKGVR